MANPLTQRRARTNGAPFQPAAPLRRLFAAYSVFSLALYAALFSRPLSRWRLFAFLLGPPSQRVALSVSLFLASLCYTRDALSSLFAPPRARVVLRLESSRVGCPNLWTS
uniref:Transmembrane protein n=1 Tax=Plectus sambesii TaxID=2011161 RepID=A0A914XN35_9BILA